MKENKFKRGDWIIINDIPYPYGRIIEEDNRGEGEWYKVSISDFEGRGIKGAVVTCHRSILQLVSQKQTFHQ